MRNALSAIILASLLLPSVSVFAQNKVVVIPMGGGDKIVNVTNWAGEWTPGTSYQAGQTVQIDGSSYVCLTTHVSGDTPDFGYWGLMASKGDQGDPGIQGPQGDPGPAGPPGAGNSWIRVYDANNTFMGYLSSPAEGLPMISQQNYIIQAPYFSPTITYDNGMSSRFYYLTDNCTGNKHILRNEVQNEPPMFGVGRVFVSSVDNLTYYYNFDQTTPSIPASTTIYAEEVVGVCSPFITSELVYMYEILENNPAVTGFHNLNNLTSPAHFQYNLPPTP